MVSHTKRLCPAFCINSFPGDSRKSPRKEKAVQRQLHLRGQQYSLGPSYVALWGPGGGLVKYYCRILIVLIVAGILPVESRAQSDRIIFDFEGDFDINGVVEQNAQTSMTTGADGNALGVVMYRNQGPSITLTTGQAWGTVDYEGVMMDITNSGETGIGVIAEVNVNGDYTSAESFIWVEPGRTDSMFIGLYRHEPPAYTAWKGLLREWTSP